MPMPSYRSHSATAPPATACEFDDGDDGDQLEHQADGVEEDLRDGTKER
jgi:hypothetical protein